jgi:hypothetical protein
MEELGKVNQLLDNFNGYQGTYIVLSDKDSIKLNEKYHNIKAAKQVIGAYFGDGKHHLALFVNGKGKIQ